MRRKNDNTEHIHDENCYICDFGFIHKVQNKVTLKSISDTEKGVGLTKCNDIQELMKKLYEK